MGEVQDRLAAEGYRFYAEESLAFAEFSLPAVSEALGQLSEEKTSEVGAALKWNRGLR